MERPDSVTANPLVSCVMPTRNRARFIPWAIRVYQSQTYQPRELVIIDNGDDETESLIPDDPSIRYSKQTGSKHTTGQMRNLCAEAARGEILCHFDSDDWSAPDRVADQIARLKTGRLTGYSTMWFHDVRDGKSYHWAYNKPLYALGTSLCYRKSWWQAHPFEHMQTGEDYKFFLEAVRAGDNQVTAVPVAHWMVALIHSDQTSPKNCSSARYHLVHRNHLPEAFHAP